MKNVPSISPVRFAKFLAVLFGMSKIESECFRTVSASLRPRSKSSFESHMHRAANTSTQPRTRTCFPSSRSAIAIAWLGVNISVSCAHAERRVANKTELTALTALLPPEADAFAPGPRRRNNDRRRTGSSIEMLIVQFISRYIPVGRIQPGTAWPPGPSPESLLEGPGALCDSFRSIA